MSFHVCLYLSAARSVMCVYVHVYKCAWLQVMHGSNARLAQLFASLPTTFVLPKEAQAFVEAFHRAAYGVEPSVTQPKGLNLWCAGNCISCMRN